MKWFADNSRYQSGFACPWIRLLKYHANDTGWVASDEFVEANRGLAIHKHLENLYQWVMNCDRLPTKEDVASVINPTTNLPDPEVEILGLVHAYARAILP